MSRSQYLGQPSYCLGTARDCSNFWIDLNASRRIWNYHILDLASSQLPNPQPPFLPPSHVSHPPIYTADSSICIFPNIETFLTQSLRPRATTAQLRSRSATKQQTPKLWHILQLHLKGLCQAHTLPHLQLQDFPQVLQSVNRSSPKAGAHKLQVPTRTMAIQILNRAKYLLL